MEVSVTQRPGGVSSVMVREEVDMLRGEGIPNTLVTSTCRKRLYFISKH